MTDSNQDPFPHTWVHDVVGACLVALGATFLVSGVLFIRQGEPTDPAFLPSLMSGSVKLFGTAAILWLCLGLLFLGGRLFLRGKDPALVRDGLGFAGIALGLAILMGGLSPVWGGWLGRSISGHVHPAIGVILGGALVLAVFWVAWLRVAPGLAKMASKRVGEGPGAETEGTGIARPAARPAPKTRPATEDPSGVSSAEADALLPSSERDEILAALRAANRSNASSVNRAPSPYPVDVRREGGIPQGTRPIENAHEFHRAEPTASAPRPEPQPRPAAGPGGPGAGRDPSPAPAVRAWSPAERAPAPVRPGADLAGAQAARGAGAPAPASDLSAAPARESSGTDRSPAPSGAAGGARAIPISAPPGAVGSPSWESEATAEEALAGERAEPELSDAEVVDAYGTPLELVAELRGRPDKPAPRAEPEPEIHDDEEPGDTETWAEDEDAADETELDEEEPASEPEAAPFDEPDEQDGLSEEDELGEEDAEDEEDEADELEAAAPVEARVDEELLEDEEEEQEEEQEEDEDEVAEDEDAELEVAEADPEAGLEAESEAPPRSPAPEPSWASAPAEREVVLQPVQNSLFDAEPEPEPAAPPSKAHKERTVVLEPAPAKPSGDDLVYRCGLLFLREKRVAVSMLQREFGLDFKQATAVLDQLQNQGLIGPYLGGQRRDILLTAEEWRAKVGAAS